MVIGSDDEQALVKALTSIFPEATHVLCSRHLRQNAKQKLIDDAITLNDRKAILNKIFGNGGIIESEDSICFEELCDQLEMHCSKISENFVRYFKSRLRPQLKAKATEPANLDRIDSHWTNNNCESINHILKQAVDWKSKPLVQLVETLQNLVKGQFQDLRSALIGPGEYRLAESHKQFQVTKNRICPNDPGTKE